MAQLFHPSPLIAQKQSILGGGKPHVSNTCHSSKLTCFWQQADQVPKHGGEGGCIHLLSVGITVKELVTWLFSLGREGLLLLLSLETAMSATHVLLSPETRTPIRS